MRGQKVFVKASMIAAIGPPASIAARFGRVFGFGFVPSNRNVAMRFARFIAPEFGRYAWRCGQRFPPLLHHDSRFHPFRIKAGLRHLL